MGGEFFELVIPLLAAWGVAHLISEIEESGGLFPILNFQEVKSLGDFQVVFHGCPLGGVLVRNGRVSAAEGRWAQ